MLRWIEGLSPLARGKRASGSGGIRDGGPIPAGAGETYVYHASLLKSRAYPRWRGGNWPASPELLHSSGLSPLARGKPLRNWSACCPTGPIPAGAGETRCGGVLEHPAGAYPRWRGGNRLESAAGAVYEGLSPLARGKLASGSVVQRLLGPIPAGAGETHPDESHCTCARAHPRWRGGNFHRHRAADAVKGLSPLARGKRYANLLSNQRDGPIPAGAGETEPNPSAPPYSRAYPRWRGGNTMRAAYAGYPMGLSPLARGKRIRSTIAFWVIGPIPAGAGETHRRSRDRCLRRAYPRWRGGNQDGQVLTLAGEGLSPLARGKLDMDYPSLLRAGPIPAGAGETMSPMESMVNPRAYPRWRGGNNGAGLLINLRTGLSPLARGKRCATRCRRCLWGPIPAGAGETCRGLFC